MSEFLQFAQTIVIVLVAAKLSGYLANKFGQPSVLGELLAGVILGPSLLNITHLPYITNSHLTENIKELGELGVLLIMFLAGLELQVKELTGHVKVSALAGVFGVIMPVLLGWGFGLVSGLTNQTALFLGLTLGATSVSISVQTLMELKVLRSRVGLGLLGAAIFDDVLVIVILSTFLALVSGNTGFLPVLIIFGRILAFLLISLAIGRWLLPFMSRKVSSMQISQGSLVLALVIMLIYGIGAELIGGMAAITGTFIAGLMFGQTPEKSRIEQGLTALGYGFFIPIFFISIGLSMNIRAVPLNMAWFIVAVSIIAIIGKWAGAGFGARIAGFSWRESIQLGAGMISRGEVGLIVGAVGLSNGLVDNNELSAIVVMVVVTTIITPPVLRSLFIKHKEPVVTEDV